MLFLEPLGELLDGDGTPIGITPSGWIIAVLGGRDDRDGAATRLLAGKYAAWSETDASRPSAGAVLYNVSFATAGQDAQPEARQIFIPNEILARSYLRGINDALGEFRHELRSQSMVDLLPGNRPRPRLEAQWKQGGASRGACLRKPTWALSRMKSTKSLKMRRKRKLCATLRSLPPYTRSRAKSCVVGTARAKAG